MDSQKSVKLFKNQSYLQMSFTLMLFFASWAIWWSFFQIWLTSESNGLGLSGSSVGTIYSTNSFVTLILMFFYGVFQDKLVIKRTLLIFCSTLSVLVGPFFVWIYGPLIESNFILALVIGSLFYQQDFYQQRVFMKQFQKDLVGFLILIMDKRVLGVLLVMQFQHLEQDFYL